MAISSNTLFHVTKTLTNLKGILKEGFKVNYCYETLSMNWLVEKNANAKSKSTQGIYVPMVSFSDIPLSKIKNHFNKYESKFAIGLSKKWGINKGLNPILYTHENSQLTKYIINFMYENFKQFSPNFGKENTDKLYRMFNYILSYTKNYKGIIKHGKIEPNNFAYDEKEWRYIPTDEDLLKIGINKDLIDTLDTTKSEDVFDVFDTNLNKYLREQIQKIKLSFLPNDIKYIIINKKSDAKELIEFILNNFKNDADKLIASIFTLKQIFKDFK